MLSNLKILSIQHRKIVETLQNNFTETLQYYIHGGCETLLNHYCKIHNIKISAFCYIKIILQ